MAKPADPEDQQPFLDPTVPPDSHPPDKRIGHARPVRFFMLHLRKK